MPTSKRPTTRPGSAPSPRAPFSEHHPIPITFFVPRPRVLPSQASFHCHPQAHKPAPPLTTPPHLRHLYAVSPPQAAPPGSAPANQAPPPWHCSQSRLSRGRWPRQASQRPSGQKRAPPALRSRGRGRGSWCSPRLGQACLPGSQSRGPGQARRDPQPASPARRPRLSPRRRGSGLAFLLAVQRGLCRRRRRAPFTRSSTAPDRPLKSKRAVARPLAAARARVSRPRHGPRNVTG